MVKTFTPPCGRVTEGKTEESKEVRMHRALQSLTLLLLLSTGVGLPADWTRWRGPDANGITGETDWNPRALAGGAKIVWQADVGTGHSSVAVRGSRLYTMGNRELADGGFEDVIWCLDATTGKAVWSSTYGCVEGEDPGPCATPIVEASRVYAISREGHLHCLDATTGRVIWKRHLVEESLIPSYTLTGSPVVEGNLLLINAGKAGMAFDKLTGETVWASHAAEGGMATPVVFSQDSRRLAAIAGAGAMYVVDTRDGAEQWRHPWAYERDPIVADGKMLLICYKGSVLLDIGRTKPQPIWQSSVKFGGFASWVMIDGHAYGLSDRRKMFIECMSLKDGSVRWSHQLTRFGSLIAADHKLIILDGDGKLIIAEASPAGYREISSAQIIHNANDDTGKGYRRLCKCWTNPVLANGRIYGRNSYGKLVCVDMRTGSKR
jgi:outer membrane protein assembly factor BamB